QGRDEKRREIRPELALEPVPGALGARVEAREVDDQTIESHFSLRQTACLLHPPQISAAAAAPRDP
ncbi:MAG TPA: hypothetical protein VJQ85_06280, partial [Gaiellaceae bacterium]|nr:hypothetical protein [Gaiellaceae bacterium]